MHSIKTRSYGIVPVEIGKLRAPSFLILRAFRNWDFPKGGADDGENALEAATRELKEETGLTDFSFDWGEKSMDTKKYSNGKVATYYLAKIIKSELILPINPELGKPEHDEYRWATFIEAQDLLPKRLIPILQWANQLVSM